MTTKELHPFRNLRSDLPASLVVFLVAVPLCLRIAMASGTPLISGMISGIVGGVVVGSLSRSSLGVSGPAAGLAAVVFLAIDQLESFPIFLSAVVLCGLFQLLLGFAKAGFIGYFFSIFRHQRHACGDWNHYHSQTTASRRGIRSSI